MAKNPILTEFGVRLRKARKRAGMSQGLLGATAGEIAQSVISEYETGDRNPTLLMLHRLAGALGVTAGELVEDPVEDER